jgi:ABC-type branched-subunit amino acid transport system substrate-binding protein
MPINRFIIFSKLFFVKSVILCFLLCSPRAVFPENTTPSARHKIGFVLTLSGKWAEYGEAQKNALELARKDHPELFTNIDFIYEDCQYLGRYAVSAFHKLREKDKVDLIFVWGVRSSLVLAPLVDRYKLPLMISGQISRNEPKREYAVRTINYAEQYSEKLVEYLRYKGIKRIGIIKTELAFYNDRINGIKSYLKPGESLEVFHELLYDDTDLRTVVSSLRNKKFDIIGLYLTPRQIINFYREAENQKLSFQTFGSTPFQSRDLLKATAGLMEGAIYIHNDISPAFHKRYLSEYGNDTQIPWSANAYDFAILAGELLNGLPKIKSKEKILALFRDFAPREGAGGKFKFVHSDSFGGYFEYPVVVKQVTNDDFKVIYR